MKAKFPGNHDGDMLAAIDEVNRVAPAMEIVASAPEVRRPSGIEWTTWVFVAVFLGCGALFVMWTLTLAVTSAAKRAAHRAAALCVIEDYRHGGVIFSHSSDDPAACTREDERRIKQAWLPLRASDFDGTAHVAPKAKRAPAPKKEKRRKRQEAAAGDSLYVGVPPLGAWSTIRGDLGGGRRPPRP